MGKYPDCFPPDFERSILPANADYTCKEGYRLAVYRIDDRRSYLSTYEQSILEGIRIPGKMPKSASSYATSLKRDYIEARQLYAIKKPDNSDAIIAFGVTHPSCGPSRYDANNKAEPTGHISWWIFKDAKPYVFFKEVRCDE